MAARSIDSLASCNFANLRMDGLDLLIPQSDVLSLEPLLDVRVVFDDSGAVGEFERDGTVWRLYALSKDLTLLFTCPDSYRVAVLLKNVDVTCGLLCEQVQPVAHDELVVHHLPTIMNTPQLPLMALAHYGDEIRCISNARLLTGIFSNGAS